MDEEHTMEDAEQARRYDVASGEADYLNEPMPASVGVEFARVMGRMPYGGTAGAGIGTTTPTPAGVLRSLERLADYLAGMAERQAVDEMELAKFRHQRSAIRSIVRDWTAEA